MIYLTGAGCGDPSLLTLKAKRVLEQADCILYDRLLEPAILQYATSPCEKIYVGKENHHHQMSQSDIQELLVQKASECNCVVRLKGGDPYVFGRGSEEAMYLQERGLSFEVIPGISSAIGGLAYAGIPVTDRSMAGGVRIMSAHNKQDKFADLDFASMAHTRDTLIFMMGLSALETIVTRLLEAGKPSITPIALVTQASRSYQKTLLATLGTILQKERSHITSPAIIVVGNVVKRSVQLNYFEKKPLHGKCYLMAVMQSNNLQVQEQLQDAGACVETITCGRRVMDEGAVQLPELSSYTYLVFASKTAIHIFFKNLYASGRDARALSHLHICTMGAQSAQHLRSYGLLADTVPTPANSTQLAEVLKSKLTKTDHVLLAKAHNHNEELCRTLQPLCTVDLLELYHSVREEFTLSPHQIDGILFTSSFCVRVLMEQLITWDSYQKIPMYSIGKQTSETLRSYGCRRIIELAQANKNEFCAAIIKEEEQHV